MMSSRRPKTRVPPPSKRAMTMAFALSSLGRTVVAASEDEDRALSNAPATFKKIVTSYDSDHSSAGSMFDMKARQPITIRGVEINAVNLANSDDVRIEIWTKSGSYKGHETDRGAWTLWVNETVASSGLDAPTTIPPSMFAPIPLGENNKRAFYIACSDGPCLRYSSSGHMKRYVNDEVILFGDGAAKRRSWEGGVIAPRLFNGGLNYERITSAPTKSPTLQPSTSPSDTPTSSPIEVKTLSVGRSNSRVGSAAYASQVSYAGEMFDVHAKDNIIIQSIAFNTPRLDFLKIQLYTREGSYVGNDKDLSKWELIADIAVQGQGLDNPTWIPEGAFDPVLVRIKKTQSFYITSDGPHLRASRSTTEGEVAAANSDLEISQGLGKRIPIDGISFSQRIFNGELQYYTVDIPTPAPTTSPPTATPTARPTMNDFRLRLYWQPGYYWQETHR